MPRRTAPDGGYSSGQFMAPDYDLTEVAARLTDVFSLRRDGRVFYYSLCDSFAGWNVQFGSRIIDNTFSFVDKSSFKFTTLPGLATLGGLTRIFPYVTPRPVGLEFTLAVETGWSNMYIDIGLTITQGTVNNYFDFILDKGSFKYKTSGGGLATIENLGTFFSSLGMEKWINCKFVVDATTSRYLRAYINDKAYDLNVACQTFSPPITASNISLSFFLSNQNTGSYNTVSMWLDNIIMTIDEY